MKKILVGSEKEGEYILLSKVNGEYYATSYKCSHFGLDLSLGLLLEDRVICPFHLASFSVKTGEHEHGPGF